MEWWQQMQPRDQWTLGIALSAFAVALYGAILSTINLVSQRRLHQPKLRVTIEEPMMLRQGSPTVENLILEVRVSNTSRIDVHLSQIWFKVKGDRKGSLVSMEPFENQWLPHELPAGKSKNFLLTRPKMVQRLKETKSGIVKIRAEIGSEAGYKATSKWYGFDLDKKIVVTMGDKEQFFEGDVEPPGIHHPEKKFPGIFMPP
jgi:hypothetical protein